MHDARRVGTDQRQHPVSGARLRRRLESHLTRLEGADARSAIHHTPNADSRKTTASRAQPSMPFVTARVITSGDTMAEIDQLRPNTPWYAPALRWSASSKLSPHTPAEESTSAKVWARVAITRNAMANQIVTSPDAAYTKQAAAIRTPDRAMTLPA